jgi:hypothetical protein
VSLLSSIDAVFSLLAVWHARNLFRFQLPPILEVEGLLRGNNTLQFDEPNDSGNSPNLFLNWVNVEFTGSTPWLATDPSVVAEFGPRTSRWESPSPTHGGHISLIGRIGKNGTPFPINSMRIFRKVLHPISKWLRQIDSAGRAPIVRNV